MISTDGLEYEIRGDGEPVLLIHGAHIADSYRALAADPSLKEFRKITYCRRGYGASEHHTGPYSITQTAEDALALLDELGIECAHIAGHSSGGVIALQMALAAPQTVHSLVLLEPALMMVPSAPAFFARLTPAIEKYSAGDAAAAVATFLAIFGPDWRDTILGTVPGGVEQAEKDASTFFEVELPAVGAWIFDARRAKEIFHPVLYVLGTKSGALFEDGKQLCLCWIPQMEEFLVEGANHLLQQDRRFSALIARGMRDFFLRHPIVRT